MSKLHKHKSIDHKKNPKIKMKKNQKSLKNFSGFTLTVPEQAQGASNLLKLSNSSS
jgi:hypothetical protein